MHSRLRLDPDEINYTEMKLGFINGDCQECDHINGIHILPYEKKPFSIVPEIFRDNIYNIFNKYSNGIYELKNNKWIKIQK